MRTLKFIVHAQRIEKDPACDFKGLVGGSEGYLQAEFKTDDAWKGCAMAADFIMGGKAYGAPVRGSVCSIPAEALRDRLVGVRLVGKRAGYRIETNVTYFRQEVPYGDG